MTTFADGPAQGQKLMLHRSPVFLRVVQAPDGSWDALDQLDDEPAAGEQVFVYRLFDTPGWMHLNRGGGKGGTYSVGSYVLYADSPDVRVLRSTALWREWTEQQPRRLANGKML